MQHAYSPQTSDIATYRERGVATPFTTPQLFGARVRSTGRNAELLLPNLSGKRGFYVLSWSGAQQFCRPTVHDTLLCERIEALERLTPTTVRLAAREMAALGHAGSAAKAAAVVSVEADASAVKDADFQLLIAAMSQWSSDELSGAPIVENSPELQRRGRRVIVELARGMSVSSEQVTSALERLGAAFAPIGVAQDNKTARLSSLIENLDQMQRAISEWNLQDAAERNPTATAAEAIARSAAIALDHIRSIARTTRASTDDMKTLLREFIVNPEKTMDSFERPSWVLDGWDRIVLLWTIATETGRRRATVFELAQMLPLVPREIADWVAGSHRPMEQRPMEHRSSEQERRGESFNEGPRVSGAAAFALIARNEQLRARTV